MDPVALYPLLADRLPSTGVVLASAADAAPLREALPGADVRAGGLDGAGPHRPVDAVVLAPGELASAGERAPALVDAAVRRTRPGGWVVVVEPSATWRSLAGDGGPGLTAGQLEHVLAERGLDVRLLAAPGAAAGLAGRGWRGAADLEVDATAGLLDAGPLLLAIARTPKSAAERTRTFFASIARKIVAASALVLDGAGDGDPRLLLVHDAFKGAWTLPGGLVDADESPEHAAVREAHEEAGVDVVAGDLLGVFAHASPDRVHLVYAAHAPDPPATPVPVHDHEITAVRWVALPEALDLLDASVARKVRLCLDAPGGTHRW